MGKSSAYFSEFWRKRGVCDEKIRERIVVVCKRLVPFDRRPPLLRGQQGFEFFSVEQVGGAISFANSSDWRVARASTLLRSDRRTLGAPDRGDGAGEIRASFAAAVARTSDPFVPRQTRKIFLAKPASDMAAAYDRLTRELEGWGYEVCPGREEEIPNDRSALDFVDAALSKAEISIHLLGESVGRSPEICRPSQNCSSSAPPCAVRMRVGSTG